jgi:hypothetical protein
VLLELPPIMADVINPHDQTDENDDRHDGDENSAEEISERERPAAGLAELARPQEPSAAL